MSLSSVPAPHESYKISGSVIFYEQESIVDVFLV